MVSRNELISYLDDLLGVQKIRDYCPNGLQVEGKETIKTLVTGVTASAHLLEKAVENHADAVLVHHGYFWKNESPEITGMKYHRLKILFEHQMNLFAYHLPLDVHLQYGNNAQLASILNFETKGQWLVDGLPLVFYGDLYTPQDAQALSAHIFNQLKRKPLHISSSQNQMIQKIAWCTGAAQQFIEMAAKAGCDAYITGEVSEYTTHLAQEMGIHFFACGHHATERYGIKALGEHLASQFGLQHHFVDIDNPV